MTNINDTYNKNRTQDLQSQTVTYITIKEVEIR